MIKSVLNRHNRIMIHLVVYTVIIAISLFCGYHLLPHYSPKVIFGLAVAIPVIILIFYKPIFGLMLIALVSPFDDLQRFTEGVNLAKIIGLVTLLSVLNRSFIKKTSIIKRAPLGISIALLILSYLFSYLVNGFQLKEINYLLSLFSLFILYFITTNEIDKERNFNLILYSLFFSATCLGVSSMYSILTGTEIFIFRSLTRGGVLAQEVGGEGIVQLIGASANPNAFAVLFVLLLPISFAKSITEKSILRKSIFLVMFLIYAFVILLTASRSAILGSLAGSIIMPMLIKVKRKVRSYSLIFIFFLISLFVIYHYTGLFKSVEWRVGYIFHYYDDPSITNRLQHYPAIIRMAVDNPLGVGPGVLYYNKIKKYSYSPAGAHNTFLEILGINGFIGLLAILLFTYRLFRNLLVGIKTASDKDKRIILVGLLASNIAFWIHSSFHSLLHWNIVWMFFGMSMAYLNMVNSTITRLRYVQVPIGR